MCTLGAVYTGAVYTQALGRRRPRLQKAVRGPNFVFITTITAFQNEMTLFFFQNAGYNILEVDKIKLK